MKNERSISVCTAQSALCSLRDLVPRSLSSRTPEPTAWSSQGASREGMSLAWPRGRAELTSELGSSSALLCPDLETTHSGASVSFCSDSQTHPHPSPLFSPWRWLFLASLYLPHLPSPAGGRRGLSVSYVFLLASCCCWKKLLQRLWLETIQK